MPRKCICAPVHVRMPNRRSFYASPGAPPNGRALLTVSPLTKRGMTLCGPPMISSRISRMSANQDNPFAARPQVRFLPVLYLRREQCLTHTWTGFLSMLSSSRAVYWHLTWQWQGSDDAVCGPVCIFPQSSTVPATHMVHTLYTGGEHFVGGLWW
eukprot:1160442-Pelagomonas_calceolata.AAC.11